MPNVGDKEPDFGLYDTVRKVRRLSEFLVKAKLTIIAFSPGPSRESAPKRCAHSGTCTESLRT